MENKKTPKVVFRSLRVSMLDKGRLAPKGFKWLEVTTNPIGNTKEKLKVTIQIPANLTSEQLDIVASKVVQQINES